MKIWFDKNSIWNNPRIPFLNPILWPYNEHLWWYDDKQVANWNDVWKWLLEYSEKIEECDYIIYPRAFRVEDLSLIKKYIKIAGEHKKDVIIFSIDDYDIPYNFKNSIVFRTSFSKWHKREYPMPSFPEDLYQNINIKTPTIDVKNISISYCWYTWYDSKSMAIFYYLSLIRNYIFKSNFIKKIFFNLHMWKWYFLCVYAGLWRVYRKKMHDTCLKIKKYKYNYIIRHNNLDPHCKDKAKKEYIDNIINNDFSLVIRGTGNYSFRFYEIMSLWKIPIFIDTNCRLPFDDEINYKDLFIWVPFEDISNIEKYIDIYISKNKDRFPDISREIRKIYEDKLKLTSFYTTIIKKLNNKEY